MIAKLKSLKSRRTAMEDSFKVRVDKVFGSLSTSTSPNLSSLWSLTDDEIQRNEWNRAKDEDETEPEPIPIFASRGGNKKPNDFSSELQKDLLDLDDDLDDGNADEAQARDSRASWSQSLNRRDGYDDEEWEIKSNIGLDCTLDYEEEEDQYDKVAVGEEKTGDRLYMKDINDYVTDADTCDELPNSLEDSASDPRANHVAAKIRLREDAEAAKKIGSLRVSEKDGPSAMDAQINTSEDGNLKPILKRGDNHSDSKKRKRVRFDSECKDSFDEKTGGEEAIVSTGASTLTADYPSGIPDYMRNPSKYTRYTLDSGDIDDKSNAQAYMDFLNMLKKSNTTGWHPDEDSSDLPKTVTFIPKRKTGNATMAENNIKSKRNQDEYVHRRGLPIGIAGRDAEDEEVCAMEEDELETTADKIISSQKSGRIG